MIQVLQVTKHFGTFRALDAMDFEVSEGEYVGLLGSNGSGKSTLYRCILGIIPFEGEIRVEGKDSFREGKKVRGLIGYMPQQASLHNDLTVNQTLQFYTALRGGSLKDAYSMLERVELSDIQKLRVGELSGGMKQRLSFIIALIGDPKILLLDEPTVSMDVRSQQIFLAWLRELKEKRKTVLLSTHLDQDVLSIMDRTLALDHGQLVNFTNHASTILKAA